MVYSICSVDIYGRHERICLYNDGIYNEDTRNIYNKKTRSVQQMENIYIGAKSNGIDPWVSGEITYLELYTTTSPNPPEKVLLEPLRMKLIMNQNEVVTGEIPNNRRRSLDKDSTIL